MKPVLAVLIFLLTVVFAANCGLTSLASSLLGLWQQPLTSGSVDYEEFHFNNGNTYVKLKVNVSQYEGDDAMGGCELVTNYEDGTYATEGTTITFNRARTSSDYIRNCDDTTKDTSPEYTADVSATTAVYTISGSTLILDTTEYSKE
jgi:hypothetical protein